MPQQQIIVFCTFALRSIILELAEPFKAATGIAIHFELDATPNVKKRIAAGEPADVILIARTIADELAHDGHLRAEDIHDVTRSGIGIAICAGASRPDISTPEALKQTLLATRCVVYTDPASGGASGIHFAAILKRLGIAEAMASRSRLNVGTYNSEFVACGEADLAVQQIAEILPVPGIELLGPLPEPLQVYSVFSAAIGRNAPDRKSAEALVAFLRSPQVSPVISKHGMQAIGPA